MMMHLLYNQHLISQTSQWIDITIREEVCIEGNLLTAYGQTRGGPREVPWDRTLKTKKRGSLHCIKNKAQKTKSMECHHGTNGHQMERCDLGWDFLCSRTLPLRVESHGVRRNLDFLVMLRLLHLFVLSVPPPFVELLDDEHRSHHTGDDQ